MKIKQGLVASFILLTAISPISEAAITYCVDAQNSQKTLAGLCKEFTDQTSCTQGFMIAQGTNPTSITLGASIKALPCQWDPKALAGKKCSPSTSAKTMACTIKRTCSIEQQGTYTLVSDCSKSTSSGCTNSAVPSASAPMLKAAALKAAMYAPVNTTINVNDCAGAPCKTQGLKQCKMN